MRTLRLQTELPGVKVEEIEEKIRSGGGGAPPPQPPSITADSANTMLWIAMAVFVLVLAMTIAENLRLDRRSERRKASREDETERDAVKERMAVARNDADAMAGDDNYADAMHILLLQSLNEMRRRLRISFAVSLTSREILQRTRLDREAYAALSDIIARVEISYFGTHHPDREEYLACRQSYATLTRVLQQGGRA